MLLVKSRIALSSVHGIGLFAAQFISRNEPVWKFEQGFDLELPLDFPELLSSAAREQFFNYAFVSRTTTNYVVCADDARFFNHSVIPNIINLNVEGLQEGL